jgi:hypothetical protein
MSGRWGCSAQQKHLDQSYAFMLSGILSLAHFASSIAVILIYRCVERPLRFLQPNSSQDRRRHPRGSRD